MRTKTLLLTAALGAAGVASSLAQPVFSVNAVGYVNLTILSTADGSKGTLIANPLNGTNNNLSTILPLPLDSSYDGTVIYRWKPGAPPAEQNYSDAITFLTFLGGWQPDVVIDPGEGFFIYPVGANPLKVTFVGEVPQGTLNNPMPGPNLFSVRSSIVPQAAPLGDEATPNTLGFPAEDGDVVYLFIPETQKFSDSITYLSFLGGWQGIGFGGEGPTIPVATSFFIQKSTAATKASWTRTFSVN